MKRNPADGKRASKWLAIAGGVMFAGGLYAWEYSSHRIEYPVQIVRTYEYYEQSAKALDEIIKGTTEEYYASNRKDIDRICSLYVWHSMLLNNLKRENEEALKSGFQQRKFFKSVEKISYGSAFIGLFFFGAGLLGYKFNKLAEEREMAPWRIAARDFRKKHFPGEGK